MYPFSKRISLANSGIFLGYTDFHSHILPGVDDGIQTMADALEVLSFQERLNVKTVWLTPHIKEDIPNTTNKLRQRFQELRTCYTGSIQLHLAAEYMLDSMFTEYLEEDDFLPLHVVGEKSLLVEVSSLYPQTNIHSILAQIMTKGYRPMLAHPERYLYMSHKEYEKLKEMGIKLQLNLYSLLNCYGTEVAKRATWLLKHGMYDLSGTDVHNIKQLMIYQSKKISVKQLNSLKELTER